MGTEGRGGGAKAAPGRPSPLVPLRDLDLLPTPHVYPLREDSVLLASSLSVRPGERFLEVGCGLGLSALTAARAGARAVGSDVNPHALASVRSSAKLRGLQVEAVRADLFAGLGRFDVVACNPPYLPTGEEDHDPDPWHDLALDGGADGLAFVRGFLSDLPDHLLPGGRAYLLVASLPGAPIRTRGLPVPAPRVQVVDLVGDRVLPAETLWVLELMARSAAPSSRQTGQAR